MRRYGVPILIVGVAVAAWVVAFRVMTSYRAPDVGFITTPPEAVQAMVDLAEVGADDVVYDLGCGDARLVIAAALRHPTVRGVGIDIDPAVADQARAAVEEAGLAGRVRIVRNDLFREDLTPATVVLMYLMPSVNEQLVPELGRLRPGTRIVSHWYRIPGFRPTKVRRVTVHGLEHPAYLYVTPLERE
jgi:SAM-dependent methyltransferase